MAIIQKIRERSGFAIGAIALGLALFVVGGDLLGPNSFLLGNRMPTVGKIAGNEITLEDFNKDLEVFKQNYTLSSGKTPTENELASIRENAWNYLIFKNAFVTEFDKLSLLVTDKELVQMVQGDSLFISPQVKAIPIFINQQTGKFDKQQVVQYFQLVDKLPEPRRSEQKFAWKKFEDDLRNERMRLKYENLFRHTTYVTQAEAQREYQNQNTKAAAEYVYVPFASIVDSTIKVTDDQVKAYLNENKAKYKDRAFESRNLEYVAFDVAPSSEDTLAFSQELKSLAKSLAVAQDDSTFAKGNSDASPNPVPFEFLSLDKIPSVFFSKEAVLLKGGIYGPFLEGKNFRIFKVSDVKDDSTYYVRAAHILIKWTSNSDKDKAEAKEKANDILKQIKEGAAFEEMAKKHGSDGTKDIGGDLGFFGRGKMVKPFEEAVFAINDPKLLPNLVETQFGYHIVKVTHPKTNKKYKLAVVERILEAGDATRDVVYKKAEKLVSEAKTTEQFKAAIKKDPSLVLLKAERVNATASQISNITNARELIRWAFADATKMNSVSPVFDIPEQSKFVLATVTGKTEKDVVDLELFREEATQEIRKKIKAERIVAKLNSGAKDLNSIAEKYGKEALVSNASDLSMNSFALGSTGFNPFSIGAVFGLKKDQISKPIIDETGVFVLKVTGTTPASSIADYTLYKNQLTQSLAGRATFMVGEAVKKASNIEDLRYKFF